MKRLSASILFGVLFLVLMAGCGSSGGGNLSSSVIPTSTAVIGTKGGSVTSDDGKTTIQVPAGALTSDTTITVTTVDENLGQVGQMYRVAAREVSELVFSTPVTVTLKYDPALLSAGAVESESKLALAGPIDSWEILQDSAVDTVNHIITATTLHFSDIGILQTFSDNSVLPKLDFPLLPLNPYNVTIESVFDHSMTTAYSPDGIVVAYSGDEAKALSSKTINVNSRTGNDPLGYSYPYIGSEYVNSQGNTIPDYDSRNPNDPNGPPVLAYDGHPGYDYAVSLGTPVYAATSGTVTVPRESDCWNGDMALDTGQKSGKQCYGTISITSADNKVYSTMYVHLSQKSVTTGNHVNKGEQIGLSGHTGATGSHLHFEVRKDSSIPVDPYGWSGAKGADPYAQVIGADSVKLWEASPVVGISGSWSGTFTGVLPTGESPSLDIAMELTQSGADVSGNWVTTSGSLGTVSGAINGNTVDLTLAETFPCAGTIVLTGTYDNDAISFSGSGSDCGGTFTISGSIVRGSSSLKSTSTFTLSTGDSMSFELFIKPTPSGADLSGNWVITGGTSMSGTLSGTIGGNAINFTLTEISPCAGTFDVAETYVNGKLIGLSGSGSDCRGPRTFNFN
ncbi:MAG TPA: M23 family metallopeptidase [Candidatus Paceibacterota bacterium]|nr:M23 family metallopeptidase [Candidatus Paceibacterota bacterium]